MAKRIPAQETTRERLHDIVACRLGCVDARSELVPLATQLIVEETLEKGVDIRAVSYLSMLTSPLRTA